MAKKLMSMGEELVNHSKDAEISRHGLADELFPYIWIAAKTMSTRAISAWFKEKQNLQLSPATVSKVLRETDERMRNFFVEIRKKESEFYGMIDCLGCYPDGPTALFDQSTFESRALTRNNVLTAQMADSIGNGGYAHLLELYNTIRDEWFALPTEFRDECKKYIDGKALEGSPAGAEAPAKEKKAKKKG